MIQAIKFVYYTIAFLLELGMVGAFFVWGYRQGSETLTKYLFGVGLAALVITFWGLFQAPKATHRFGFGLRMICEIVLFSLSALMLCNAGYKTAAAVFGAATVLKELLTFVFKDE